MTQTSSLPSYADVTTALAEAGSAFQAADAHGLLCGVICATSGKAGDWEKLILGTSGNAHNSEVLQELYEISYHQMSEFSFEFSLLLPDDMEDINTRTEALGLWCQGFITGLGQSVTPIEENATPEVAEALDDITEIAQVSYGDIPGSDEDETAYFELVEYIRLTAIMLFHELKSSPSSKKDDPDELDVDSDDDNYNDGLLH